MYAVLFLVFLAFCYYCIQCLYALKRTGLQECEYEGENHLKKRTQFKRVYNNDAPHYMNKAWNKVFQKF